MLESAQDTTTSTETAPGETTARPEQVEVAVIGGGIGGLAAAVALRHAGLDAHVFERVDVLREVGGAVVVREPSMDLFDKWGLGEALRRGAVEIPEIELRDGTSGEVYGHANLADDGTGRAWSAHRADVQMTLLNALPPEVVHLGLGTDHVRDEDDGAVAVFTDGTEVRARLIVGADGIKSVIRGLISDDDPIFAKLVVLRGLVAADALPDGLDNDRIRMWGTAPHALAILPLRGGEVIALDTIIHAETAPKDLWASEVPVDQLLERFEGFDSAVINLIASGSPMVKANPVYEREPLTSWTHGHITLLGDAAHPMAPRMGQGANSAIQDAGALADAVLEHGLDDLDPALLRYEAVRIPIATAMQLGSRGAPPAAPRA